MTLELYLLIYLGFFLDDFNSTGLVGKLLRDAYCILFCASQIKTINDLKIKV